MFRYSPLIGIALGAVACSTDTVVAPGVTTAPPAYALVTASSGPAECVSDSKLIGRIELSSADEPGTWWRLTREGFDSAGITDYLAAIEGFFGMDFADLDEAAAFLVDQILPLDANQNGYVCAYRATGTRTSYGDPNFAFYVFHIRDDKHAGP